MSVSRITITIDDDTLAELRQQAGQGEVSAYVVEALRERLRRDPVERLLARLDDLYGPLTADEIEAGEQWWDQMMQRLSSTQEPSSASPAVTAA